MMRFTRHLRQLNGLFDRPIAHRGLHSINGSGVENTQSAFAAAVQYGYAIECDVQLTADQEAIVFHDDSLERLTKGLGAIANKTTRELKSTAFLNSDDRMQTLGELLDQVDCKVPLVVEIKSQWDGNLELCARVVDVIQQYKGSIALMSFDPVIVARLAEIAPSHVRGVVADRAHDPYYNFMPVSKRLSLRTFAHLNQSKPHFVSFDAVGLPYGPVQALRDSGMPVICWTIRSAQEASHALRYADQITFEGYLPG